MIEKRLKNATLFCADCREIVNTNEIKADLILTDPPYGINLKPKRRGRKIENDKKPPLWAVDIFDRCTDKACVCFAGYQTLFEWTQKMKEKFNIGVPIVWVKDEGSGIFGNKVVNLRSQAEFGIYGYKSGFKIQEGKRRSNIFCAVTVRKKYHPTVKPTKMLREIIDVFCPPDGTVFDPFMGSGSTGVAALEMGRNFIGIEIVQDYFNTALNRINEIEDQISIDEWIEEW